MTDPKLGNRIIVHVIALALAIGALFARWGVATVRPQDVKVDLNEAGGMAKALGGMMAAMLSGMKLPVTGLHGSLSLGGLSLPLWTAIAATVLGLALSLTNVLRVSAIPRKAVAGLLLFGAVVAVWAIVEFTIHGSVEIGGFLLLAACVAGLLQQRSQPA